jgi:hypothetical protein
MPRSGDTIPKGPLAMHDSPPSIPRDPAAPSPTRLKLKLKLKLELELKLPSPLLPYSGPSRLVEV